MLSYPLHIIIAALGARQLTRELMPDRPAAATTAMWFTVANGWTWAHLAFGAFLCVTAWIPWIVWTIFRHARTGRPKFIALAALLWCFQLLAGAPQVAWYAALNYGLLAVILNIAPSTIRNEDATAPRWRPLVGVLSFGAIGAGLAAPQLIPTAMFVGDCERASGLSWEEIGVGALSLKQLWQSLTGGTGVPEDAETTCYVSYVGLILIASSLFAIRRSRPLVAIWTLLIVCLLFCNRTIGRALFEFFPLYADFHDPKRILGVAQVWLCVLTGGGLSAIASGLDRFIPDSTPPAARRYLACVAGALCAATCAPFVLQNIDLKTASPEEALGPAPSKLASLLADGSPLNQRFITVDGSPDYSYNYTSDDFAPMMMPNLSSYHGLEDIQGYDPFIPRDYVYWLTTVNGSSDRMIRRHFGLVNHGVAFNANPAPWRAIVTQRALIEYVIAQTKQPLPGRVEPLTDDGQIVAYLPPRVEPIISRWDTTGPLPVKFERRANRTTITYGPTPETHVLRIVDRLGPGWTVTLNGESIELKNSSPPFSITMAPNTGEQRIELRYWPPGLTEGLGMCALTLLILLLLANDSLLSRLCAKTPTDQ